VLLLVGWSQLALGRHYPSDILAGWAWALAWVCVLRNVTKGGPG
jgi:membrane-associated phospholipid phosphatase